MAEKECRIDDCLSLQPGLFPYLCTQSPLPYVFSLFQMERNRHGLNDYRTSVEAIEKVTQFISCEFAVRPFIIRYPDEMMRRSLSTAAAHC